MSLAQSVLDRFASLFKPRGPDDLPTVVGADDMALPEPNSAEPTGAGDAGPGRGNLFGQLFGAGYDESTDRAQAYRDYEMIDDNIPEMSRALSIIASNATSGEPGVEDSFHMEYAPELPEADRELAETLVDRRLALPRGRITRITRFAARAGDYPGELVVNEEGEIVALRTLEPRLFHRLHDAYGNLAGYRFDGFGGLLGAQKKFLEPWRVVHWRYDPVEGYRYGRSVFASARALAYRVLGTRDALAYELMNHATARNVVLAPRPARWEQDQIDAWVDDLADRIARQQIVGDDGVLLRRPLSILNGQDVILDYPVDGDGKGSPPIVQPLANAPIGDLTSGVEHLQDALVGATGVPKTFLGIERGGEGIGGNRLTEQARQFMRQMRQVQQEAAWFVLEIVRRQFILLGQRLEADAIRVVMPSLQEIDQRARAEILQVRAQAAYQFGLAGAPPDFIWYEVYWDGDEQVGREMAARYGYSPQAWALRSPPVGAFGPPAEPGEVSGEALLSQLRALRGIVTEARKKLTVGNRAVTLCGDD